MITCVSLYEWARHAIWGRRFGVGLGDHVPEELCEVGPYRYIRHPIYMAYVLAYVAGLVALPHWVTGSLLAANLGLFVYMANDDEKTIEASPLAADYSAYRERTGKFFPKLSSRSPGKSTP